ncbi:MAG: class I SAM-dependent methyltransferase [Gammaproteobacteria bacterium]|nr:class I SAM-dependent methyltransferase [Gammaproteobacteria bacterium]MDH3466523.1 class I SAM-dependent methyltransferase [Gammaproteobacteria bacterium]
MIDRTIKTMKLYSQVERVFNELRARGIDDESPLRVEELTPFDQYHYHGTSAVEAAAERLRIVPGQHILEIGSGIGGPARYLADSTGAHVTALELQADLNRTAATLTQRCGLEHRVEHRCGDVLKEDFGDRQFDAIVSWLAFLHIPDRQRLLNRCLQTLKPDGGIYVEDFTCKAAFTADETRILQEKVYCHYVPSENEYVDQLRTAGFTEVECTDMTASWREFVTARRGGYRDDDTRLREVHGDSVVDGLNDFYDAVVGLFQGGHLGGARIIGWKPR